MLQLLPDRPRPRPASFRDAASHAFLDDNRKQIRSVGQPEFFSPPALGRRFPSAASTLDMTKRPSFVTNKPPIAKSQPSPSAEFVADENTYQRFIENLPVMFYAVTPTPPHTPIYISPTFACFGYPLEEWMTDSDIWDRVMHPDDRDHVLNATRDAMGKGEGIDFEYRVVCMNGSVLWVRDRSCFIKGRDGELLCWQGVILDITERRLAEQELVKREKLYRTLAATIPKTAVLLFDHNFRYTLADGQQLKNHKWAREMFEGKTLFEVFPPEIADEWAGYYRRALDGEDVTVEMENEDGAFQVSVMPVRDENGGIFAGMVMWQDITETKRVHDAIKESEARYRQLFENANDVIYVHDLDGNYLSINQVVERVLGYALEEAMSMNVAEIVVPEHLDLVKENLSKKLTGDAAQTSYEVDCIKKDGTRTTLEITAALSRKMASLSAFRALRATSPSESSPRKLTARAKSVTAIFLKMPMT